MWLTLIVIMVGLIRLESAAQTSNDFKRELPTEKVDQKVEDNSRKNRPTSKRIRYIIKNKTSGLMYGNPCALLLTRGMGFEYVVEPVGATRSESGRLWNNFKVKLNLSLRHTPFWKINLKKKLRDCGIRTGDRVG